MTVAQTAYGAVRGTEIADGILAWRGVPYAAPPVGELRLRPPQPPQPWPGVRDATRYGNRSPQPPGLFPEPDAPPTDEDCLYLNVTAPARAPGATDRPVLLWVHGGGFEMGHGTDQAGDGAAFAKSHGLVVVTFNYRLGALGFLDLEGERPTGAHGLHDQIAALRWTYRNIAGFGGDPARITVYGLSAGGKTVTNLLASPLTAGMISGAAQSSGGDHVKSPEQAARLARRFFAELGAGPDRIRAVPAGEILRAQLAIAQPPRSAWVWRPSADGVSLAGHPLRAIEAGAAAGIPLLAQTCARECAYYQLIAPDAAGQADRVIASYFGERTRDALLAVYAASHPELDETALRTAIMTDERYIVRTDRLADAQSAHAPVWRSRYDGPYTGFPEPGSPGYALFAELAPDAYAGHGGDGTGIWLGTGATGGTDSLSDRLHAAWGAFVTAGDPGWDRYTAGDRNTMIFDPAGPHLAADPFASVRKAWDGLDWQPGPWWHHDGLD
jgi:para-nitrobenzyl esterase